MGSKDQQSMIKEHYQWAETGFLINMKDKQTDEFCLLVLFPGCRATKGQL